MLHTITIARKPCWGFVAQPQNALTYHTACANVEVSFDKHKHPRKIKRKSLPYITQHHIAIGAHQAAAERSTALSFGTACAPPILIEYPPIEVLLSSLASTRGGLVLYGACQRRTTHAPHCGAPRPVAAAGRPKYISIEDVASALLCAAARASRQADCLV